MSDRQDLAREEYENSLEQGVCLDCMTKELIQPIEHFTCCYACRSENIIENEDVYYFSTVCTEHKANKDHSDTIKKGDYYYKYYTRVVYDDCGEKKIKTEIVKVKNKYRKEK